MVAEADGSDSEKGTSRGKEGVAAPRGMGSGALEPHALFAPQGIALFQTQD